MISHVVLHFVGDYILQSDWMANNKTKSWLPAIAHALTYTIPFLIFTRSLFALAFIFGTHLIIDHYRLARYVVWAKNFLGPKSWWPKPWEECKATGYNPDVPPFMSVWLMIIADNTIHIICNAFALSYL